MSNRDFNKKFAIALGATLGAASALNSVSVSASEKYDISALNSVSISASEKYDIYETKSALSTLKRMLWKEIAEMIAEKCREGYLLDGVVYQIKEHIRDFITHEQSSDDGYAAFGRRIDEMFTGFPELTEFLLKTVEANREELIEEAQRVLQYYNK